MQISFVYSLSFNHKSIESILYELTDVRMALFAHFYFILTLKMNVFQNDAFKNIYF